MHHNTKERAVGAPRRQPSMLRACAGMHMLWLATGPQKFIDSVANTNLESIR